MRTWQLATSLHPRGLRAAVALMDYAVARALRGEPRDIADWPGVEPAATLVDALSAMVEFRGEPAAKG